VYLTWPKSRTVPVASVLTRFHVAIEGRRESIHMGIFVVIISPANMKSKVSHGFRRLLQERRAFGATNWQIAKYPACSNSNESL
jgi:hypothetical protein